MQSNSSTDVATNHGWTGPLAMLALHLMGFFLTYATLVFIAPTFAEHYQFYGLASTTRFDFITVVSNMLSAYTLVVFLVIALDAFIVFWIARRARGWLSAYSHTLLAILGFTMFLSIAWLIQPMAHDAKAVVIGETSKIGDVAVARTGR